MCVYLVETGRRFSSAQRLSRRAEPRLARDALGHLDESLLDLWRKEGGHVPVRSGARRRRVAMLGDELGHPPLAAELRLSRLRMKECEEKHSNTIAHHPVVKPPAAASHGSVAHSN